MPVEATSTLGESQLSATTDQTMIAPNWENKVAAIRERDRERCMNCHRSGEEVTLDVHHIVPRSRGGSHRLSNLVLLCRQCHGAIHKDKMAPRVRWYSNGQMDSDEFELYRAMFSAFDLTRFDDEEDCWYIPKADAERLVGSLKEEQDEPQFDLASFM